MKVAGHYILFSGVFRWSRDAALITAVPVDGYEPWWQRKPAGAAEGLLSFMKQYFYPTFMDAQFPEHRGLSSGTDTLPGREEYLAATLRAGDLCHLTMKDASRFKGLQFQCRDREGNLQYELPVHLEYCDLYLYPDGTGIFTIKTSLAGEDITFTHISDFLFAFREMRSRSFSRGEGNYNSAELIQDVLPEESGGIEDSFNNKLKSYIILEADIPLETPEDISARDNLLYEIGTVSPVGTLAGGGVFAPAEDYLGRIIEENSLSVFRNWKALSLFDTFTVLFNQVQEHTLGCAFNNFEDLYFPVYIQNLYLKYFCFSTNSKLARNGLHSPSNGDVRNRFIEITNRYSFSHISYNFLPNMIHHHLRTSLDTVDEIEQMEQKIDRINTFINEKSDRRTNIILGFLSILALGSTFWDVSEWLQKLFNIGEGAYNAMSFSLVAITALLCLGLFFFINRKK